MLGTGALMRQEKNAGKESTAVGSSSYTYKGDFVFWSGFSSYVHGVPFPASLSFVLVF